MAKGDHIKVKRIGYSHHGIDIGDGTVVHYTDGLGNKINAEVKQTSMQEFLDDGGELQIVKYNKSSSTDKVVRSAKSRVGEKGYDLIFNNCEHFARWCKTGDKKSEQVNDVATTSGASVGTGLLATGSIATVSAAGSAAGLSGAGVMSGLAAIGPSGVVGGIVTLAAAPAILTNVAVSKVLEDDEKLSNQERKYRTAGRAAAKVGTVAGAAGTVGTISAAGSVAGLSASGITSGLAAIGSTVGGGMVSGVAISVAAPAVVAGVVGLGVYKAWKKWRSD
jgi:hypothetical protein